MNRELKESKMVLYEPRWQAMRIEMLGTWNDEGRVASNLRRLSTYINDGWDSNERTTRMWRVINYLNAIRMGYSGQGLAGSQADQAVLELREWLSERYQNALKMGYKWTIPSYAAYSRAWSKLPESVRERITQDLGRRRTKHADSPHRRELNWFLEHIASACESTPFVGGQLDERSV